MTIYFHHLPKIQMHQLVLCQTWIELASSNLRLIFFSGSHIFRYFIKNEPAFLFISKSRIHQMKDLKHHVFILLANSACENSNSHYKHCFVLWCSYEFRSEREEVKRQIMRKRKLPSRYLLAERNYFIKKKTNSVLWKVILGRIFVLFNWYIYCRPKPLPIIFSWPFGGDSTPPISFMKLFFYRQYMKRTWHEDCLWTHLPPKTKPNHAKDRHHIDFHSYKILQLIVFSSRWVHNFSRENVYDRPRRECMFA